ncbi:hypothetical protein QYF36_003868 [Acer negundo]|nr:hypothetical protein QYF36_003868 [Acer negundo]
MILSYINASLTPSVLSTVTLLSISHDVWKSLEKRYASQSRTRILQLKNQLHNTKRGDLSISNFIDKITYIADNLALAGKPVDDDDLITVIMNNVGPTYEVTVNSSQARDTSISLDDLVGILLCTEMQMNEQNSLSTISIVTAFYAPKSKSNFVRSRGSYRTSKNQQDRRPSRAPYNPQQSGSSQSEGRPKCQIYGRLGYIAINCHHRMDHPFEERVPTQKLATIVAFSSMNKGDHIWYTDSGASSHITSDLTTYLYKMSIMRMI